MVEQSMKSTPCELMPLPSQGAWRLVLLNTPRRELKKSTSVAKLQQWAKDNNYRIMKKP